jgi:hypothetical protein
MIKEQMFKLLELANGIVTSSECVVASFGTDLLSVVLYAHSDVGLVHHGNIIDAIPIARVIFLG